MVGCGFPTIVVDVITRGLGLLDELRDVDTGPWPLNIVKSPDKGDDRPCVLLGSASGKGGLIAGLLSYDGLGSRTLFMFLSSTLRFLSSEGGMTGLPGREKLGMPDAITGVLPWCRRFSRSSASAQETTTVGTCEPKSLSTRGEGLRSTPTCADSVGGVWKNMESWFDAECHGTLTLTEGGTTEYTLSVSS